MSKVVVTAEVVHRVQIRVPRARLVVSAAPPNRQHYLSLVACRVALGLPDDLACLGEFLVEFALDVADLGGGLLQLLLVLVGSLLLL